MNTTPTPAVTAEPLFVRASRLKLRFESRSGFISTEDLWDLSLESLNNIAIATDEKLSKLSRKSFIATETRETKAQAESSLQLEILKFVISTKIDEAAASRARAARAEQRKFLNALRDKKSAEAMDSLSLEDIDAQIKALGDE